MKPARRSILASSLVVIAGLLTAWALRDSSDPANTFQRVEQDLAALTCTESDHERMGLLDPAQAITELDRVNAWLAESPGSPALLSQKIHLGLVVDVPQAIEACRDILRRDPRNTFALGHLAGAYLVQRQYGTALQYAAELEKREPGPPAWNLIATIYMNQGRDAEAATWFRKSLERDPANDSARRGLKALEERKASPAATAP